MAADKIVDGIWSVGVLNPNLRVFDIVMATDYGTSYNSFLVKAQKTALIETCHHRYFDFFTANIEQQCPLDQLDYIVLNHCEPDHSGALERLIERAPQAQIIASQAGSIYLKNITNKADLKIRVVKNGDTVDLGGKTLTFIPAPFLHWPDSMFTYVQEDKVLFPCDFLGAHFCEPQLFDTRMVYEKRYESAFRGYYDAIFGPFKPYVLAGLEKIKDLELEIVCPSHGPVLTKNGRINAAKEKYFTWSQPHHNAVKTIPVFYTTAYGNTQRVAEAIREGILESIPTAAVSLYDLVEQDMGAMHAALNGSDAFAVGSPTINRDAVPPIWTLLAGVDAINNQKKPALAFGSYGWSGEAVPSIIGRMNALKLSVFGEGLKVCFVPSAEDLEKARTMGREFAKALA
ncbi:MAG: FprA family A-type flavoprotein [Oscillospiraceae bacterium]